MNKIKLLFIISFSILISSHSISDELNHLFEKLKNAKDLYQATNVEKKYGIFG